MNFIYFASPRPIDFENYNKLINLQIKLSYKDLYEDIIYYRNKSDNITVYNNMETGGFWKIAVNVTEKNGKTLITDPVIEINE